MNIKDQALQINVILYQLTLKCPLEEAAMAVVFFLQPCVGIK